MMAGLAILKHTYDLSDEALCERWIENPYFQYFCGEEFFQHALVFDRSSLTRWRQRISEERLQALLQESLSVATKTAAIKPSDLSRVVIDTTVQEKAVMFPTEAKLLNRAREKLVRLARKLALIKHQRYAKLTPAPASNWETSSCGEPRPKLRAISARLQMPSAKSAALSRLSSLCWYCNASA